ncbi:MAG: hypothetical protein NWR72_06040 [Bacteroidia bacterium]|nr:hypothetical protein [Bacteroidia bacterium]
MRHPHYTPFALQNAEVVPPLGSRQPVPGTDTSLCPPRQFSWNEANYAWESPGKEARIKVLQFRDQSFLQRRFRLEHLLLPDHDQAEWWERKATTHGPYEALLLSFRKQVPTLLSNKPEESCHRALAFGDENILILATAHYPATYSPRMEAEVVAALHSITFHASGIMGDWPSHAGFTLDVQSTNLTWVATTHPNPHGPFVLKGQQQTGIPGVYVTIDIKEGSPDNPTQLLEQLFQRNFFSSYEVLEVGPVTVQGIAGFEGFAIEHRQDAEQSRLEYVAILLREADHITFTCIAPDDRISHLATFRKLLHSFRPA